MNYTTQLVSLYEQDLNLWLETTISDLKAGDFQRLDVENLVEELASLAGRDRRELRSRLATLLEHLLKRCYVNSEYDYAGWEETIDRTRFEIVGILDQSPSLKNYANSPELFSQAFNFALSRMKKNQDYQSSAFPDRWEFNSDIESLLSINFWE